MSTKIAYHESVGGISGSYLVWGNWIYAQTFTIPTGYNQIDYVQIPLSKSLASGTYDGNSVAYIYATSGGVPTGSPLATVNVANSTVASQVNVTDTPTWVTFTISGGLTVTAGTRYAVAYKSTDTDVGNGAFYYHTDASATYAGGAAFKTTGSSWSSDSGKDYGFRIYGSLNVDPATVTTTAAASIDVTSAVLAGNVTDAGGGTISSRGYVISDTDTTPDRNEERTITDGSGTGAFSETVGSLSPGTLYYWRPFAVNEAGTAYGSVDSFTTLTTTPTVTSGSSSSVTASTATCSGNVTADGGEAVSTRGICYATSTTPTTADSIVASGSGTGSFSSNLTGLTADTTYYWRAYATNSNGTTYGTEYSFTTKEVVNFWAQSFTTTSAGTLNEVQLYLKETLAASSTAKLRIYSDSGGSPDAQVASATKTVTGSGYQWYSFTLDYAVTATTDYWIVLEDPYIVGSYYQYWGADSSGTYGACKYSSDSGTTWVAEAGTTAAFKAYIQPAIVADYDISIDYKKRYL